MDVETGGFTAGCGRLRGFVTLIYVVSPHYFSSLPKAPISLTEVIKLPNMKCLHDTSSS